MRPPLRLGTVYDFRNTPESGMDMPSLYAAIMDQVVMLDRLGLDLVWFTEHHFLDDGYLPSWVPMAGAIAARTKRVRLSSDVCLLPFNHPLRLAEDLAVLDNISNGRIEVGVGMGYAPHEFRDWPAVRAAERYRGQVYRSFNKDESAAGGVSGNTREASIPQTWVVGNVEHCVKELTSFVREYGITDLVTWAVPPGMRPEQMNGSLERFVRDVAPRVKAEAAAA